MRGSQRGRWCIACQQRCSCGPSEARLALPRRRCRPRWEPNATARHATRDATCGVQAIHCAHTGHQVLLWGREAALIDTMNTKRENTTYLKGHVLPPGLTATNDLSEVRRGGHPRHACLPAPLPACRLAWRQQQLQVVRLLGSPALRGRLSWQGGRSVTCGGVARMTDGPG